MQTKETKSTTIRIDESIKEELTNLDFVKKDTYNQILSKLIEFYEKNKKSKNGKRESIQSKIKDFRKRFSKG